MSGQAVSPCAASQLKLRYTDVRFLVVFSKPNGQKTTHVGPPASLAQSFADASLFADGILNAANWKDDA